MAKARPKAASGEKGGRKPRLSEPADALPSANLSERVAAVEWSGGWLWLSGAAQRAPCILERMRRVVEAKHPILGRRKG